MRRAVKIHELKPEMDRIEAEILALPPEEIKRLVEESRKNGEEMRAAMSPEQRREELEIALASGSH